ncbi:MAG: DUF4349 domain-containing protein [Anaerolineales bacterium]|jgi:hypothetical protein
MQKRVVILLVILAALSSGCAAVARESMVYTDEAMPFVERVSVDMGGLAEESYAPEPQYVGDFNERSAGVTDAIRLVIRNASLSVVVVDPSSSVQEISRMAEEMDGYVVTSYIYQSTFEEAQVVADAASISIRVPSARLEEALTLIKAGAVEVKDERITGQDVTEEYTDLDSRLRNLQAAEEQLREILASAVRTEDVMLVFQELRQVRQEIEVLQGRMNYLSESVRLSEISISLIPDVANQPLQIGRWQPQGTAKAAVEALLEILKFLGNAAIVLGITVLPIGVILGLPSWLIVRAVRKRRSTGKPAKKKKEK